MAVKNRQPVFAYKTAAGPLHRLPALAKLLALLPLSLLCMRLPLPALGIGIGIAALAGLACKFTLREQLTDLKPVLFYSILMYALSIVSQVGEIHLSAPLPELLLAVFMPKPQFAYLCLRLLLIVQLSALLFRTTTALEIRDSVRGIENAIRSFANFLSQRRIRTSGSSDAEGMKNKGLGMSEQRQNQRKAAGSRFWISDSIALFAAFIPELFCTWTQIDRAWCARGGRNGFRKIKTLVFVLISASFEKAAAKALAMAARGA